MFLCLCWRAQALAGSGLPDHLRDWAARHAEAASGGLALTAQLPSRHCLLLRRPSARPASTQGQLPQVPDRGGSQWGERPAVFLRAKTNDKFHLVENIFFFSSSGSHEALRCLRLNQRYLSLHLHWSAPLPDIHCG